MVEAKQPSIGSSAGCGVYRDLGLGFQAVCIDLGPQGAERGSASGLAA